MKAGATVVGDARLRVFVGFPVPELLRTPLHTWGEEVFGRVGRVVPAASLHVTVAFLGSIAGERVEVVCEVVRACAAPSPSPRFAAERVRVTRGVGMLALRDLDGAGTELVGSVQARLEAAGLYAREARPWLAHITVARWKERPARVRTYVPVLGEIVPSEIAVYLSVLRAGGAQYEVLDSAALGRLT